MQYFIIQINDNGLPCELGLKLIEACRYQTWFHREQRQTLLFNSDAGQYGWWSHNIYDHHPHNQFLDLKAFVDSGGFITSVGTLEYCETYMKNLYGKQYIKAINIPEELRDIEFTHRKTCVVNSDSPKISKLLDKYTNLFIKSAVDCKKISSGIFNQKSIEYEKFSEKTSKLFISEVVDIVSEWRTFIYRTNILDIRQYSGDWDKNSQIKPGFIRKCVETYSNGKHSPAYTLDIGLLQSGEMVVIEVHNFISCGLYGFDDERFLPQMLHSAFKYEISE